jgi:hypothetical protein
MPELVDPGLVSLWVDTAEGRIVACPGGEGPSLVSEKAPEETALVGFLTVP